MQELIIGEGLKLNAIRFPDKEALVYLDRRYTYKQLNERVNRLANALTARGFKKGDKIAVLLHNCNEYLEIFLALAKTGVLTVPLTYRAVPEDWEYMINFSDASGLFFEKEFEEVVKGIRPKLSQVEKYFGVGPEKIDWAEPYDELLSSGSDQEPGVEIHETDPAWISFTSGTTGRPKGCVGCHRGWVLQMPITCMECDIRQTDIFLNTGPIYHLAPYWMCLLNLYIGTTLITMREFDPLETLKFIDREKVTGMFMVPTMFNMILNLPEEAKKGWDLTSLRVISSGAAPLLTKTKEETLKFFPNASLYEFYSASELGIATNLRPEDQMRKVRCCGKPFTGVEIKLLDEEGREVKVGEVGELYMKGFNTFKEYYKNPQATAESRRGEFTTVGDMARMDEE
ncbi:MAG: class I adenylate-forming enzyme family protein, partial [Pseudomonadota bacterium]